MHLVVGAHDALVATVAATKVGLFGRLTCSTLGFGSPGWEPYQ